MSKEKINILIGGEAGQGVDTLGQLIAKGLIQEGYRILVTQSYMSRIRGGHNTYSIRVGIDEILAPTIPIDILICLNEDTLKIHQKDLVPDGLIIVDESSESVDKSVLKVPYKDLGKREYLNIAALGVVGCILDFKEDLIIKQIEETLQKKDSEVITKNKEVLTLAYTWTKNNKPAFSMLPKTTYDNSRIMMNGNEGIATGAISSGLKFAAFYPMSPSTSIMISLIDKSEEFGIIVEQAEDEISAINMAIGASFAGAPSMVATSGGGFALMIEGISLSGMTETPIVVAIAQRPGPATGLPTRTEQADLEMILHAGHGEFPRAIYAPGTIEQCFNLTRKAFEIAEKSQSPVFILTDQFLADSYRSIENFEFKNLEKVKAGHNSDSIQIPYQRFRFSEDGLSPRLIPGKSEHLVVADSDEHDEAGHITEDLDIRKRMVEKRLKKEKVIHSEVIAPDYIGDDNPDLLFICWGSTRGSVIETVKILNGDNKKAAVLHFSQVYPLEPNLFMDKIAKAKEVISVESNAQGQFARLLRRETGLKIEKQYRQYDGLPIFPESILNYLKEGF